MTTTQHVEARRAGIDEIDEIADVLADAFRDYPWTRWTVDEDDHRARIRSLQRLAMTELAFPHGQVWVTLDVNGGVAGAAVWMDPSPVVPPEVDAAFATQSAVLAGTRHARSEAADLLIAPLRPKWPHYYLGAVGTRPGCRRGGHGRGVLQPVLAQADRAGADAYLETSTPSNLSFYSALGFRVAGEVDAPGGGPHVWAMLRSSPTRQEPPDHSRGESALR